MLVSLSHRDIWYFSSIDSHYYEHINNSFIDIYTDPFAELISKKSIYFRVLECLKKIQKDDSPFRFIQSAELIFGEISKHLINDAHKNIVHNFQFF